MTYNLEKFLKGLEELQIELSDNQIQQFIRYYEMLVEKNKVMNLTATETTAKRYLRQLTEFGYLEAHGGNKNRTYSKKD